MSGKDGASSKNDFLSLLTTQELEDSLRFAMLSEGEVDIVQIDALLAELYKRDIQKPDLTPEESLKIFKEQYSGKESEHLDCAYEPQKQAKQTASPQQTRRLRRPIVRAALVAAIIIALIFGTMIVAQAAGLDVFGAIARWTDEIFSFSGDAIDAISELSDYSKEVNGELTQMSSTSDMFVNEFETMEEALKAYGIEKQITPTWVPEGFEMVGLEISEFSNRILIQSTYANGDSYLLVNVNIADSSITVYEKTEADVIIFSDDNIEYYIFENNTTKLAVWYTDGCECSINGQVTSDELITMINSIK